jgi:hypothetical protein
MIVSVEQHLVRLQEIVSDNEGSGIGQLRMRDLQLGALIADDRPIFGPVELEGLARLKCQRHERSAPCRLALPVPICLPFSCKCCDPAIQAIVAEVTRSAWSCFSVRFCLRGLLASDLSQTESRSANGSSLLGRSGTLNFGSTPSERRYLRIVVRERPVRREMSRIDN